jgi:hypothetical protein
MMRRAAMSKHKKYPADTPLTLQMVIDHHYRIGNTAGASRWEEWVEPPPPEPKDGELWLVEDEDGCQSVRWYQSGQWYIYRKNDGIYQVSGPKQLRPIELILTAEVEDAS